MVSVIQRKTGTKKGKRTRRIITSHHNQRLSQGGVKPIFTICTSLMSPQTNRNTFRDLGIFLTLSKLKSKRDSIEERCNRLGELAKRDSKRIVNYIFNYLQLLKNRVESKGIKASTLRNNIKPIKLFCEQMDIDVPWKRPTRGMPKERKYKSRGPKAQRDNKDITIS